jgi:hypothetical protein
MKGSRIPLILLRAIRVTQLFYVSIASKPVRLWPERNFTSLNPDFGIFDLQMNESDA